MYQLQRLAETEPSSGMSASIVYLILLPLLSQNHQGTRDSDNIYPQWQLPNTVLFVISLKYGS